MWAVKVHVCITGGQESSHFKQEHDEPSPHYCNNEKTCQRAKSCPRGWSVDLWGLDVHRPTQTDRWSHPVRIMKIIWIKEQKCIKKNQSFNVTYYKSCWVCDLATHNDSWYYIFYDSLDFIIYFMWRIINPKGEVQGKVNSASNLQVHTYMNLY